jgi:hypothetical protein
LWDLNGIHGCAAEETIEALASDRECDLETRHGHEMAGGRTGALGRDWRNPGYRTVSLDGVSTSASDLRSAGAYEWMIDALTQEATQKGRTLDGHLVVVGEPQTLPETSVTARCHFVARSPTGQVLVGKLARKLANQVVEYCIPPSRIAEARAAGSTEAVLALQAEALELFATLDRSGEAGELLLYLLNEIVLEAPQLLCKMSLKTHANMHVHGADGIHGRVLPDGKLALYWGESKLHASPMNAIRSCFESLVPFLVDDGSGRSRRDLLLLRDGLDLSDPRLVETLGRYLSDDTVESTQVEFRGAALVGFDLADYPEPYEADGIKVCDQVMQAMAHWHNRIGEQVTAHQVAHVGIEVFCVPVPSVDELRDEVREALRLRS